ncbi:hypothetical protein [Haloechinothrix halophila]|uniref:hypothetical protein n=1 Tax=Haloechinothrix halophila TaxID=1069073 RepID=UPI00040C6F68|nr:hypothetical protein [Haloechinothrix halophila]
MVPVQQACPAGPDIASYSWRDEYVAVHPGPEPHLAVAPLRLAIRRQGSGAMVVDVFPRARIARVARQLAAATRPAGPPRRPDSAW